MANKTRKNFDLDNFADANQLLGKQVGRVGETKNTVSRYKSLELGDEFKDDLVCDTYDSIQAMLQDMYEGNVEDEITLNRKKARLYADEEEYAAKLEELVDDISNYTKDLLYSFGDLGDAQTDVNADYMKKIALTMVKQKLSREEYERYIEIKDNMKIGDPVVRLKPEEKQEFVELYERMFPHDAINMSSICGILLNDGYPRCEEDALNIKLLAYTANEPYKSIYIDNIHLVKGGNLHHNGWPSSDEGIFSISVDKWEEVWGQYRTSGTYSIFFHETSHCIDEGLGDDSGSFTTNYKNIEEVTLNDVLEADVRKRINEKADEYLAERMDLTQEEKNIIKEYVEDSIMNQVDYKKYGEPDFSMIMYKEKKVDVASVNACYDEVLFNINREVMGFSEDTYGSLTGNTLTDSKDVHEAIIREGEDGIKYRVYWVEGDINSDGTGLYIKLDNDERIDETVDFTSEEGRKNSTLDERVIMSDGQVEYTHLVGNEFFAGVMAANLCQRDVDLKAYDRYYDETKEYFENMLDEMIAEGKKRR